MKVYVLTSASAEVVDEQNIRDNADSILFSGAVHATLEGAQAAALADLTDLMEGMEERPLLEWEERDDERGHCWFASVEQETLEDDTTYLVRELEVLP